MFLTDRCTLSTLSLALACLIVSPSHASAANASSANGSGNEAQATTGELRIVDVPGSPVRLALWQVTSKDGQVTPHYAISLDGRSYVVSTATDYSILLRRATFDPLVATPNLDKSMLPAGESIYIVQFVTQPLEEFRAALTQLGGTIYSYLGNHSYVVKLPGMASVDAAALPFVRWVGKFHGEYRV